MAAPAVMPRQNAPASGGKGGANTRQHHGMMNKTQPAQPQMNNPTAPNVMQQSATALTDATQAATAGTQYQPMNVGTQGGYLGAQGDMGRQQVGVGNVGTQGGYLGVDTGGTTQSVGTGMGSKQAIASNVVAGQLAGTDLSAYTNPYESQVVQQSMSDMERARKIQQMQQGAKMSAAGAFGGSRHGIAEAETNRAFFDRAGAMAGQLRQQGFQNAQQMAQQDIASRMQAGLANQATQLTASQANQRAEQTGLQRQLQAGMSNQQAQQADFNRRLQAQTANQRAQEASRARQLQAGVSNQQTQLAAQRANQAAEQQGLGRRLQASQSNQQALEQSRSRQLQAQLANQQAGLGAAGQRLAASGQLGQLSRQGFDMGRTLQSDVMQQGTMQQMMQQQLIDSAKQQFAGYTGQPTNTIGLLSQALGASTIPQSQQTRRDLGMFDYATLAASMFGGG
jgi:hypothetical protein